MHRTACPAVGRRRDGDWPVPALVRRARFVLCGRPTFSPTTADIWLPLWSLVRAAVGIKLYVTLTITNYPSLCQ